MRTSASANAAAARANSAPAGPVARSPPAFTTSPPANEPSAMPALNDMGCSDAENVSALGSFAGGLVVNAGGLLATGPVGALFALAAAALALALVRMTARRSGEIAAEAARTAATAREPR